MKEKNIKTMVAFEIENKEYSPVKNAIAEELETVISKVYQLDHETGWTLHYLTDIMMNHFHEDIARVSYGDLSPIENNLNGLVARIEKARILLLKGGYENRVDFDNPMWYLNMALSDIEQIHKLSKKEA